MKQAWRDRPEAASTTVVRVSRYLVLFFGRTASRTVLLLVCGYFLMRRAPERRASRAYLERVLGKPPSILDVWRHFFVFATATLDRVFLLTESFRRFKITVEGLEAMHAALDQKRGVLLFGLTSETSMHCAC